MTTPSGRVFEELFSSSAPLMIDPAWYEELSINVKSKDHTEAILRQLVAIEMHFTRGSCASILDNAQRRILLIGTGLNNLVFAENLDYGFLDSIIFDVASLRDKKGKTLFPAVTLTDILPITGCKTPQEANDLLLNQVLFRLAQLPTDTVVREMRTVNPDGFFIKGEK